MKKFRIVLCALIAFGAFSSYADNDSWTGFQDGQFETIGDDGEGDTQDKDGIEDEDDDQQDDISNVTVG